MTKSCNKHVAPGCIANSWQVNIMNYSNPFGSSLDREVQNLEQTTMKISNAILNQSAEEQNLLGESSLTHLPPHPEWQSQFVVANGSHARRRLCNFVCLHFQHMKLLSLVKSKHISSAVILARLRTVKQCKSADVNFLSKSSLNSMIHCHMNLGTVKLFDFAYNLLKSCSRSHLGSTHRVTTLYVYLQE